MTLNNNAFTAASRNALWKFGSVAAAESECCSQCGRKHGREPPTSPLSERWYVILKLMMCFVLSVPFFFFYVENENVNTKVLPS